MGLYFPTMMKLSGGHLGDQEEINLGPTKIFGIKFRPSIFLSVCLRSIFYMEADHNQGHTTGVNICLCEIS